MGNKILVLIIALIGYSASAQNVTNTQIIAGVIRYVPTTKSWVILSPANGDDTHNSIGLESVYVDHRGFLIIEFEFRAKRVIALTVTTDESFSSKGYFVGASVGLNNALVNLSKIVNGKVVQAKANQIVGVGNNANLWVNGIMEVE